MGRLAGKSGTAYTPKWVSEGAPKIQAITKAMGREREMKKRMSLYRSVLGQGGKKTKGKAARGSARVRPLRNS